MRSDPRSRAFARWLGCLVLGNRIIDRTGHIVRVNRGYDASALDDIVADINRALLAH